MEKHEVPQPRFRHTDSGQQLRIVASDGRVVIAEGGPDTWYVYPESDPHRLFVGHPLDGLTLAEALGSDIKTGDYPSEFDEWTDAEVRP